MSLLNGPRLARKAFVSLRIRGTRQTLSRIRTRLAPVPASRRFRPHPVPDNLVVRFALPEPAPTVSVIIPVFNHWDATFDCLRALAAWPPLQTMEVILVDDGSTDATELEAGGIDGLRYHRRAQNGGFIAACQDGAALGRGEYLLFLNNDTVPQPGWLDTLISTFIEHPDAGLVGAQLLDRDGTLQEAGGLVFSDASAANYGRARASDDPRFAFVREVDYCSGAAIAIPRDLFHRLGGFDRRFEPAYYEDTDLAFKVRRAGRSVLYQPASRVVHHEGTTSGTDVNQGVKSFQTRNRSIFAAKWTADLTSQPTTATDLDAAAVFRRRPSVLVVDSETPQPDNDSGSVRLVNLMRLLLDQGAHVVFLPTNKRYEGAHTQLLQQMGVEVWYAPYVASVQRWMRAHGSRFDTVLACRHHVAGEVLPWARKYAPQAQFVLDTVDLQHIRERRLAEIDGNPHLLRKSEETRHDEIEAVTRSDVTLVVSDVEQSIVLREVPGVRVEVLSNLHEVVGSRSAFSERRDVVFVGGFRHAPNISAVLWFTSTVWPLITAQLPDAVFHCIGSGPPAEITALGAIKGVRIHGHVPDLGPFMDGCRIAVAPLLSGAGVKGKINMSMAHGQPVVATSTAVEGMYLTDGFDVLVADDPEGYADAVVKLYREEHLWAKLSANGLVNVERHFSMDAGRDVIQRVLLDRRVPDGVSPPTN